MGTPLMMTAACAVIGAAAWRLTWWWLRETPPAPPARRHPLDDSPHIVTVLGAHGRPNPLQYERLPDYRTAQARQRELTRQGRACVVTHADSGQIRHDLPGWLGFDRRVGL